jgi:hypothetical protein
MKNMRRMTEMMLKLDISKCSKCSLMNLLWLSNVVFKHCPNQRGEILTSNHSEVNHKNTRQAMRSSWMWSHLTAESHSWTKINPTSSTSSITLVFRNMNLCWWRTLIKRTFHRIGSASRIAATNLTQARTLKRKAVSLTKTQITILIGRTVTNSTRYRWAVFLKTVKDLKKSAQICSMTRPISWSLIAVNKSTQNSLSMGFLINLDKTTSRYLVARKWYQQRKVIIDAEAHHCIDQTWTGMLKICRLLN